jgi:rhomboid protease GluP
MDQENTETQETAKPEEDASFWQMLIPTKGYFITPILMYINVGVFIIMAISGVNIFEPASQDLLDWGANLRSATLDGQPWRLLTCCFLHIGLLHLVMNMYALLYIGLLLEPIVGGTRFLAAYLLTGIAASTASLFWHDLTISAGASGAIFGMYGVFLALLTTKLIDAESRTTLLSSIGVFVVYNLVSGLREGVDNAAHIGGLVSGVVAGYIMLPSLKNTDKPLLNYGAIGLTALLVLGSTFYVFSSVSNDVGKYQMLYDEFSKNENLAIAQYAFPDNASDSLVESQMNQSSAYWNLALNNVEEMQKLDLAPEFKIASLHYYTTNRLKLNGEQIAFIHTGDSTHLALIDKYLQSNDSILKVINEPVKKEDKE